MLQPIEKFQYYLGPIGILPKGYQCNNCGKTRLKLWRLYQTSLDEQELTCATCSANKENENIETIDKLGRREASYGRKTNQIGWRAPAIPKENGANFWGYTSVPQEGWIWWESLPTQ